MAFDGTCPDVVPGPTGFIKRCRLEQMAAVTAGAKTVPY
jgi:hypothetical protein